MFAGFSGGRILRLAGDERLLHAMFACQAQQKPTGTNGIVMSAKLFPNLVADISDIANGIVAADPKGTASHHLSVCHHLKEISRQPAVVCILWNRPLQGQGKFIISQTTHLRPNQRKSLLHRHPPQVQLIRSKKSSPSLTATAARDEEPWFVPRGATLIQTLPKNRVPSCSFNAGLRRLGRCLHRARFLRFLSAAKNPLCPVGSRLLLHASNAFGFIKKRKMFCLEYPYHTAFI